MSGRTASTVRSAHVAAGYRGPVRPDDPVQPDGADEPSSRRRSTLIAAGLVVLAALAAVAIVAVTRGDEDPPLTTAAPSTTVVELQDWQAQVQQGCQEWNERYAHLEDADPGTAEQAVEHTRDVEALARGLVGVLDDAGLPDADRERAEELASLTEDLAEAAAALNEAAESGDGPGVGRATEQLESLGERLNTLATELEVPACGGY